MAARLLAELSQEKPRLRALHRKNLESLLRRWYREEADIGYIYYSRKSKLGANAMALRTLVYSPYFPKYDKQAERLAAGILSLMDEHGAFQPWLKEPSYEYRADYLLTFYSGEAILALVEYYEKTDDQSYLEAAIRSQDFYIDKYVMQLRENYYPAYVPWHTQSLNKLYRITGEQRFADAIFVLNDELLIILDRLDQVGRFYSPDYPQYGAPHASSDGVYTEGLAYAYEVARWVGDEAHQRSYREALELAVGNLVKLQYTEDSALNFLYPDKIAGALRVNVQDYRIRTDTTQHAIDAYRKILQVFDAE
jgi:hypothetical protein